MLTPIVSNPFPRNQDLNKLESTPPKDDSTQVTACLANMSFILTNLNPLYSITLCA